jgi:hypothetical protein
VADNPASIHHWSEALRFPLGRSGLLAAAAVAGAIVYWRANERQRSRHAGEIDEAIAQGRAAADAVLGDGEADSRPFDQR